MSHVLRNAHAARLVSDNRIRGGSGLCGPLPFGSSECDASSDSIPPRNLSLLQTLRVAVNRLRKSDDFLVLLEKWAMPFGLIVGWPLKKLRLKRARPNEWADCRDVLPNFRRTAVLADRLAVSLNHLVKAHGHPGSAFTTDIVSAAIATAS